MNALMNRGLILCAECHPSIGGSGRVTSRWSGDGAHTLKMYILDTYFSSQKEDHALIL